MKLLKLKIYCFKLLTPLQENTIWNKGFSNFLCLFRSLAIILDTIGFITNLPHDLVNSFQSTLTEVLDSDLLLHVRDISNPNH